MTKKNLKVLSHSFLLTFSLNIPPEEYEKTEEDNNGAGDAKPAEDHGAAAADAATNDDDGKDSTSPGNKITAPDGNGSEAKPSRRPAKRFRLEAIHVSGLERGASAENVYEFFKEFNPVSFEWVDGGSANVIWALPSSAAKAMICLSRPLLEREDEVMEVNERVAGEDGEEEKKEVKVLTKEEIEARVRTNVFSQTLDLSFPCL